VSDPMEGRDPMEELSAAELDALCACPLSAAELDELLTLPTDAELAARVWRPAPGRARVGQEWGKPRPMQL